MFDVGGADPRAYYALGQAHALGIELKLLARRGSVIPFDVSLHVIEVDDPATLGATLGDALNAAVYGMQTPGLELLMHATLTRCRSLAAQAVGTAHADVLLAQLEASVASPLDFRGALQQFLAQLGNSRLVLLHPRWPARYPEPGPRRCFVVMPFSEQLAAKQALYRRLDADLEAAGATVVRGDAGDVGVDLGGDGVRQPRAGRPEWLQSQRLSRARHGGRDGARHPADWPPGDARDALLRHRQAAHPHLR